MFGNKKGLAKKLVESGGTVAWATVLEGKEQWSSESSGWSGTNKITDHMRLKLRVEPDGEPAFEAVLKQAFSGTAPFTGYQCKVVYDPADRSQIAVLEDSVGPPGLSHEQVERSAARRTEMLEAVQSGHLAEYIEQRKQQALRGALGGTVIADGQVVSGGPAPAEPQQSVADQLTKLADLHDRGVLTDAEFQAQKAKLLAQ